MTSALSPHAGPALTCVMIVLAGVSITPTAVGQFVVARVTRTGQRRQRRTVEASTPEACPSLRPDMASGAVPLTFYAPSE